MSDERHRFPEDPSALRHLVRSAARGQNPDVELGALYRDLLVRVGPEQASRVWLEVFSESDAAST